MTGNNWCGSASAFMIGIGVGATLGVLFAPTSGEELREGISGAVQDCVDGAAAQSRRIKRRARNAYDDVKERFEDAIDAGERAYWQSIAERS